MDIHTMVVILQYATQNAAISMQQIKNQDAMMPLQVLTKNALLWKNVLISYANMDAVLIFTNVQVRVLSVHKSRGFNGYYELLGQ